MLRSGAAPAVARSARLAARALPRARGARPGARHARALGRRRAARGRARALASAGRLTGEDADALVTGLLARDPRRARARERARREPLERRRRAARAPARLRAAHSGSACATLAEAALPEDQRLLAALAAGELGEPGDLALLASAFRRADPRERRLRAALLLSIHRLAGEEGVAQAFAGQPRDEGWSTLLQALEGAGVRGARRFRPPRRAGPRRPRAASTRGMEIDMKKRVFLALLASIAPRAAAQEALLRSYDLGEVVPYLDRVAWVEPLFVSPAPRTDATSERSAQASAEPAETLVEVLSQLLGDELRQKGRSIEFDGERRLVVVAPAAVQASIAGALDGLRAAFQAELEIQVDVLTLRGGDPLSPWPSNVLAAEAATRLQAS